MPYIGLTGGIIRNSYRSLTNENPFILSGFELLNTNQKLNLYTGIRGAWSSTLSFNGKLNYSKSANVPLFVNDTTRSPESRFDVIYDQVETVSLGGQINWQKEEKIKLLLSGEYFIYSPLEEMRAWGMPEFNITVSGIYNLYDKILARADFFVVGKRWARSLYPVEGVEAEQGVYPVELKPFVDLNLSFEYRYTKRLSVFLNFNNIAAQRYQYWNKYPVMGLNLLGGLTYAF